MIRLDEKQRRPMFAASLAALLAMSSLPALAAEPAGRGSHADLVALFKEINGASPTDPGNDYRPAAINARKAEIAAQRKRLQDMAVASWPRQQKSDWLIVRAELDKRDFILNVTRPWARDPAYFVHALIEPTFVDLPASGAALETLRSHLRSVPPSLAQARETLTDAAADQADLAIFLLSNSDGVENQWPERDPMPAGAIGWHQDLLGRARRSQPDLVPEIEAALAAIEGYRDWLVANRGRMNASAGVGKPALDWYIRNVMLMPYDSDQVVTLSQRELDRLWGFYALERHRNRGAPEIALPRNAADYEKRVARTDAEIRKWLVDQQVLSIPDYIPTDWREMGFNVPWVERGTPPNFWEQIQYRDPSPDHFHAVIPGHRFDDRMRAANPDPIRGTVRFDGRWQGWAVYLEEAPLVAGFFADKPRERELIYIFGLWRAARSLGDVWNQRNEINAEQSVDYWVKMTPYLDRAVARKYAYLRPTPGHGMEYTIGNVQMWRLLSDAKRLRGDDFNLRTFHDEFMSKGQIPISLIRWEMTGKDDQVRTMR